MGRILVECSDLLYRGRDDRSYIRMREAPRAKMQHCDVNPVIQSISRQSQNSFPRSEKPPSWIGQVHTQRGREKPQCHNGPILVQAYTRPHHKKTLSQWGFPVPEELTTRYSRLERGVLRSRSTSRRNHCTNKAASLLPARSFPDCYHLITFKPRMLGSSAVI